jgi:hypothetical protein
MKLPDLPERRVAVTVRLVDAALQRMLAALAQGEHDLIGRALDNSLTATEREELVRRVRALRADLATFAGRFKLPEQRTDVRQILNAEISTIWTLLENCNPKRMKGFGVALDAPVQRSLEAELSRLLTQVNQLMGSLG